MEPFGHITPQVVAALDLPSPCYLVNEVALAANLRVLAQVQQAAQVKILLALKGFAMWSLFPQIRQYLPGVTASSLAEAQLAHEEFGREVHVYAPAYTDGDMPALLNLADHITFNSVTQWLRYRDQAMQHSARLKYALRINPEHREASTALYDPCGPGSRLGVTREELARWPQESLAGLTGLHFHTLCQANSFALERTLKAVEEKFGDYLPRLSWINFGGGHHITRADYDVDHLVRLLCDFRARHGLTLYLEPGEAVALNTGVLVTTVLDIVHNGIDSAILDTSATAHMPDVLEMPYRPPLYGSAAAGEKKHTYRLAGVSCLAGDVIGDYAFDAPLRVGDRLILGDMAHYTMVKNTTFNGVRLPAIAIYNSDTGRARVVRQFDYADYKMRLS